MCLDNKPRPLMNERRALLLHASLWGVLIVPRVHGDTKVTLGPCGDIGEWT